MGGFDPATVAMDAVGSLLSFGLNSASANSAYRKQKRLMQYQNDLSRENWRMQNAYNTPKAQMERLASAGLNPDLMYSGGAAALQSGDISSTPIGSAPQAAPVDMSGIGSRSAQIALQASQVDSQNNLNDALAKKALADAGVSQSTKTGLDIDNQFKEEFNRETIKNLKANSNLSEEQAAWYAQNSLKVVQEIKNLSLQEIAQRIDNFWADKRNQATINEVCSRANLNSMSAKDIVLSAAYRYQLMESQANAAEGAAQSSHESAVGQRLANILTNRFGAEEKSTAIRYQKMATDALMFGSITNTLTAPAEYLKIFKIK